MWEENRGETMQDEHAQLDRFDRAILRVLAADGRISITDLARELGLSKSPTQARLRRLEAAGVITGYRALVDRFWRTIDPTDPGGAFCDRGPSYETAVFATAAQRPAANASRAAAERALGRSFTTPVIAAARFWPAGREHQDYAERNPARYEAYRIGCRRSPALRRVWGDAAVE